MADVKPLRGIRYPFDNLTSESAKNKVAPPYDVIDENEQNALYKRDPENIIRIILNKRQDSDGESNNRYTRARRYLMDWLAEGTLVQDQSPNIYFHDQHFEGASGNYHTRKGFLARIRLEDYDNGVVLPHEFTHEGPKIDRLNMMKACECNVSPIFLLYDDPKQQIEKEVEGYLDDPMLDIQTPSDNIRHRLWGIPQRGIHKHVQRILSDKSVLIADGHHRYETALAYRNFRREVAEQPNPDAPYEYVMAFFVNMRHPGLKIFPTHRVVQGVSSFSPGSFEQKLSDLDGVSTKRLETSVQKPEQLVDQIEAESKAAFVFLIDSIPILARVDSDVLSSDLDMPDSVKQLDVTILHEYLFPRLFDQLDDRENDIVYERDSDKVVDMHQSDDSPVALMGAPTIDEVVDVCNSGGRMPQKSTYFYPKILSGLVLNAV